MLESQGSRIMDEGWPSASLRSAEAGIVFLTT
jgi:hypothetical protein